MLTTHAAVGDSITGGCCCAADSSAGNCAVLRLDWPARLQALLGVSHRVLNFGVAGRTASNASTFSYRRHPAYAAALASNASSILVMLGTNDARPRHWVSDEHFVSEYATLLDAFRTLRSTRRVIAITPPPYVPLTGGSIQGDPLRSMYRSTVNRRLPSLVARAAAQAATSLFELHARLSASLLSNGSSSLYYDSIHPEARGHAFIAETLAPVVAQPIVPPDAPPLPAAPPAAAVAACQPLGGGTPTCALSAAQLDAACACGLVWRTGCAEPTGVVLRCES